MTVHQPSVPLNIARWQSLAAAALLIAPAARCRAPTDPAGDGQSVPIARFTGARGPYAYFSGIDDSLRVVIRDPAAWRRWWAVVHRRMAPQPPVPTVDFDRGVVLLAALGRRPSGGYAVRIDSVSESAGVLRVVVARLEPGHGCVVSAVVTNPVDIVRVESRVDSVTFVEHRIVEDCR